MVKKRHNPKEIKFCQNNAHNQCYEFVNGETCYLVNKIIDSGQAVKMVVCKGCYNQSDNLELVEEIEIAM